MILGGEAKRQAAGTARRYRMLDKNGFARWHFVWDACAHVARPGEPFDGEIGYSSGRRPYIADVKPGRYTFKEYTPEPADIRLSATALAFAKLTAGAIVFNATIKARASPNKQWGIKNWRRLVYLGREINWIQVGEALPEIPGATNLVTPNFWDACGALVGSRGLVLHEGALHHAAAALGRPAIVIRGGFISPRVTGYAGQTDFYIEHPAWPLGCGFRVPCKHCEAAMAAITPEAVWQTLRGTLI